MYQMGVSQRRVLDIHEIRVTGSDITPSFFKENILSSDAPYSL